MKHHNQRNIILALLQGGGRITQIDAIERGIYRLSARIREIREEYGQSAVSTTIKRGGLAVYKWEGLP